MLQNTAKIVAAVSALTLPSLDISSSLPCLHDATSLVENHEGERPEQSEEQQIELSDLLIPARLRLVTDIPRKLLA